jgi:hypothetical protein
MSAAATIRDVAAFERKRMSQLFVGTVACAMDGALYSFSLLSLG